MYDKANEECDQSEIGDSVLISHGLLYDTSSVPSLLLDFESIPISSSCSSQLHDKIDHR